MSKFFRQFEFDPRSLAAFRIGIGTLLVVDLAIRATALEAHYTDVGGHATGPGRGALRGNMALVLALVVRNG